MMGSPEDRCPETCPDSKFLSAVRSDLVRRSEEGQVHRSVNGEEEEGAAAVVEGDAWWEERRRLVVAHCERNPHIRGATPM